MGGSQACCGAAALTYSSLLGVCELSLAYQPVHMVQMKSSILTKHACD